MKKNIYTHLLTDFRWLLSLIPVLFFSCSKDNNTSITDGERPELRYESPSIQDNNLVFVLGERRTINMTSANVDYIRVAQVPKAWTVTAVIDRLRITVPDEDATDYDGEGTIALWLHNRTYRDSTLVQYAVSIDFSILNYQLHLPAEVTGTQAFRWGETKTYPVTSRYVSDITTHTEANGWTVSLSADNLLSVTAPAYSANATTAADISLTGQKLGDGTLLEYELKAAIPVYTIDLTGIGTAKTFAVYNNDNEPTGLVCKERTDATTSITVYYALNNNTYSNGFVFENGGTHSFNGATYTPGSASAVSTVSVSYDGRVMTAGNSNAATTSISAYQVRDHENNSYNVIKARDKFWMDQNLRVTTNPAGTTIVSHNPAAGTAAVNGRLYTTAVAVNGDDTSDPSAFARGLGPADWHIATLEEVTALTQRPYLMYESLFTNNAGLRLPTSYTTAVPIAAFVSSTGNGYIANANIVTLTGVLAAQAKAIRSVKNTPPFIQ